MPRLCSFLLLSLLIASSAPAVTMAWTPIGNAGNACDPQGLFCFGSVDYNYNIGTYEVTNAQYAEFLNAKAKSDPNGLYNQGMGDPSNGQFGGRGGITRSGTNGSYTYATIAGRESMPVNWTTYWDALRFTNWMNNGQGNGDTETGSYNLVEGDEVTRTQSATFVVPSEDEWYKAAYYGAASASFFDYPAGTNTQISCAPPGAQP